MREVDHLREVTAVAITAEDTSDLTEQGFREIWHKPLDMRTTLMRLDMSDVKARMSGMEGTLGHLMTQMAVLNGGVDRVEERLAAL